MMKRSSQHTVQQRLCNSVCLLMVLLVSGCSADGTHLSFLDPQGPIAAAERTHFLWVVGILAVFVALPIFLFLPWVMWRYRYGAKKSRYTPGWKANLPLEIMTWAGPVVIVIVLGFMVWDYAHKLDPYRPVPASAQSADSQPVRIQAIGYDWKWLFIYPDEGIASVGVMPIPVGQPVAMQLTSATVMQSLHIPALASQIYAMGGMTTQLHFEARNAGRSLGVNNMYNGDGFRKQNFIAQAMPTHEFRAWVEKTQKTGLPLDDRAYAILAEQNTQQQLATALLPTGSRSGNIYFKDVGTNLFPAVVKATKMGKPVAPSNTTALLNAGGNWYCGAPPDANDAVGLAALLAQTSATAGRRRALAGAGAAP